MITLRLAQKGDEEELLRLYQALYAGLREAGLPLQLDIEGLAVSLPVWLKSKLCFLIVAEERSDSGKLAGFLLANVLRLERKLQVEGAATVGYIQDVYVAPWLRRQGIAAKMVAAAEAWFQDQKVVFVQLNVVAGNDQAHCFWQQLGYEDFSRALCKNLMSTKQ